MSDSDSDSGRSSMRYRSSRRSSRGQSSRSSTSRNTKPAPLVNQKSVLQQNFGERLASYLPYILKVGEVLDEGFDRAEPYVIKGYGKYVELRRKLDPYNPEALIKMFTGFSMMFFGGFFISTVAVAEAVNQGGFDRLSKNLGILRGQYRKVKEANDADDRLDEDNDGIADVKQISAEKLTFRKMLVVLRACNPEAMTEALSALYTVLLAVVATLRVKFARTVSLGASIGEMLAKPVLKFIIPVLEDMLPDEFDGWIRPVML
jgi:hypothetical protein